MSNIDSKDTWLCPTCGAIVWWNRIDQHKKWHSDLGQEDTE